MLQNDQAARRYQPATPSRHPGQSASLLIYFAMKKLFFAAAAAVAFLSAPLAQAQSTAPAPAASTSLNDADGWGDWPAPTAVNTPAADYATAPGAAAIPADDAMMHSSGVLVAPGMSSSPYRGTSTDYNGRPVARRKSFRPRSVRTTSTDPVMASSGVMLAPGMNTAPHRGVSTDYQGRPLAKPAPATPAADATAVAAGW